MTANTQFPTQADLQRAAGLEKMARAIAAIDGWYDWDEEVGQEHYRLIATAALAAWEGLQAEIQKAPAD